MKYRRIFETFIVDHFDLMFVLKLITRRWDDWVARLSRRIDLLLYCFWSDHMEICSTVQVMQWKPKLTWKYIVFFIFLPPLLGDCMFIGTPFSDVSASSWDLGHSIRRGRRPLYHRLLVVPNLSLLWRSCSHQVQIAHTYQTCSITCVKILAKHVN